MGIDKQFAKLSDSILGEVLQGNSVWSAWQPVAEGCTEIGDAPFKTALLKIVSAIQLGFPPSEALKTLDSFNLPGIEEFKLLISKSDQEPKNAKIFWLEWASQGNRVPWKEGKHWDYLKMSLNADCPTWIAGEDENGVQQILKHCQSFAGGKTITAFPDDTYESLLLKCKRGKLAPARFQTVLWIEVDSRGQPAITGIDEILPTKPGLYPTVQPIYTVEKRLALKPTGCIPGIVESIQQKGQTVDLKLFD